MHVSLKVAAVALATLIVYTQADLSADCERSYTVNLGDTCDAISAAQNVSTFQLAYVNPEINAECTNLAEGEPLCLGITGQDCDTTYEIVSGDYCALIAGDFNIDVSLLLTNNPNVDSECSNIYPGEVLCVANETIPYS